MGPAKSTHTWCGRQHACALRQQSSLQHAPRCRDDQCLPSLQVNLEDDKAVIELGKELAGKVDVLVNNAGAPHNDLRQTPQEDMPCWEVLLICQ